MKNKIISWIKRQVKDAGAKGIVFGLSGGIDSSVIAALSKEAVGRRNILALLLPCHSQPQDLIDAKLVLKKLNIPSRLVDLSSVYDRFTAILPRANALAQANIKPRLRMMTLYYFANKLNYLVCGTGNKSELSIGYFTKFGDGGCDILPIAGLYKKDVRALAAELKIPQPIIDKAPTAGLWPSQTDEGEMGITYPELDEILERIEKGKKQKLSAAKVNKVRRMIKRSEHKRLGPKIYKP